MRNFYKYFLVLSMLLFLAINPSWAQDSSGSNNQKGQMKHGQNFVDKDGDGYNDNAPDHDGDGIPNGLDPDWQKIQKGKKKHKFVDIDGDGINDNIQENTNKKNSHQKGKKQKQKTGNATDNQTHQQHRQKQGRH
ncbi:hypothetical protein KAH27_08235 [bacterium]|nr:hypothetical protein [bacterium]